MDYYNLEQKVTVGGAFAVILGVAGTAPVLWTIGHAVLDWAYRHGQRGRPKHHDGISLFRRQPLHGLGNRLASANITTKRPETPKSNGTWTRAAYR